MRKLTLSVQSSAATVRMLRCHASLLEPQLFSIFCPDFTILHWSVWKALWSIPPNFSRQVFNFSKECCAFRKVLKFQSIFKESFDIETYVKVSESQREAKVDYLLKEVEDLQDMESMRLHLLPGSIRQNRRL